MIWVWCGELFISLVCSVLLFYNNNIAQIIVLGRYDGPEKSLSRICRLEVAGYWSPGAGLSGLGSWMGGGENVNAVGVLVSVGGLLSLLVFVAVTGGNMTRCTLIISPFNSCPLISPFFHKAINSPMGH